MVNKERIMVVDTKGNLVVKPQKKEPKPKKKVVPVITGTKR
jgi:hypothetical protein